jgi:mannitol-1-/sugar-/sorbitol-6-phosphatase
VTFTCKAFLFDLDGVLVDSTPSVARIWRKWALDHNLDPEPVIAHAHGRRSIETIRHFAPELDAEQENINVENMEIADKDGITALPGALDLLRRLPPNRFAVVTSGTRPLARARMQYAGLPWPQYSVTADDVVHGKPSPEPYLKGAALLGVGATDCLVFEDAPAGIQAARAAAMRVIALTTTCSLEELKAADAILPSLSSVKVEFEGATFAVEC